MSAIHWCPSGVHTPLVRPAPPSRTAVLHLYRPRPPSPVSLQAPPAQPGPLEERPSMLRPGRIYLSVDQPPLDQPPLDQPPTDSSQSPPSRSELHKATTIKLNILSLYHTLVTIVKPNFLQHALDSKEASHSLPSKQSNCTFSPGRCTLRQQQLAWPLVSCTTFSSKPACSQTKTRPQTSHSRYATPAQYQTKLHKTSLLSHRSLSPTCAPLSRKAAREM